MADFNWGDLIDLGNSSQSYTSPNTYDTYGTYDTPSYNTLPWDTSTNYLSSWSPWETLSAWSPPQADVRSWETPQQDAAAGYNGPPAEGPQQQFAMSDIEAGAGSPWYESLLNKAFEGDNMSKWVIPGLSSLAAGVSTYGQNKKLNEATRQRQALMDKQYADALRRQQLSGQNTSLSATVAGMQAPRSRVADFDAKVAAMGKGSYGRSGSGNRQAQLFDGSGVNIIPAEIKAARGGLATYVRGGTSGQADKIPALLSDGEYVVDADVVAALGDGNNEAGARKLDKMRVSVRKHKRGASPASIPPKAKDPKAYLRGK